MDIVIDGINKVLAGLGETSRLSHASPAVSRGELPPLPIRAPTLCAGCMHRTVFYAFKQAAKQLKKDSQAELSSQEILAAIPLEMPIPLTW